MRSDRAERCGSRAGPSKQSSKEHDSVSKHFVAAGTAVSAALVTVLVVTACSSTQPTKGSAPEAPAMESHAAMSPSKPARIGTWGINLADGDHAVKPGDDFYEYSIGTWLKSNQIPADRTSW